MSSNKVFYYAKRFSRELAPEIWFKNKFQYYQGQLPKYVKDLDFSNRLDSYIKEKSSFRLPDHAIRNEDFKFQKPSSYYFDLKQYLYYFKPEFTFTYLFGDTLVINPYPTLIKARPISENNANSVLFPLDRNRHFKFIEDKKKFQDKKKLLVWRGAAHNPTRKLLLKLYLNHSLMDVGEIGNYMGSPGFVKPWLSIKEQLNNKYIFCPEGNDVATSLKWIMSSNSICIMPKPSRESWFLESELEANVHYVEVKSDLSDLEEKMNWIDDQPQLAEQIIENAHLYVERFKNPIKEELLCLSVLNEYALYSGQGNQFRFKSSEFKI